MRFARVQQGGAAGVAIKTADGIKLLRNADLDTAVAGGEATLRALYDRIASEGEAAAESELTFLTPLARSGKIICLGLNYDDHASETGNAKPDFPVIFGRFASNLIGHEAPIVQPKLSHTLDYEAELAAVIGKTACKVSVEQALDHVIGYSAFNDGSIREYQRKTPQWMPGKNFDSTGAFGPWLVSADELPAGGSGLAIETRLNGEVVQQARTDQMIFDVATTISLLSSFVTLEPGDVLMMGTPSGIGAARTPQLWMKPGDVVEVEIEKIGLLRNPVIAE